MERKDIKKLSEVLSGCWNSKEFCEYFMQKRDDLLEELVKDELEEQGYPEHANYINTDFKLYCDANKKSFDDWAELAVEKYIDSTDDVEIKNFVGQSKEMDMYLDNLQEFELRIKFTLTPEQYEEYTPTVEKVKEALENKWDQNELVGKMLEEGDYEPLNEKIYEQLEEEGFPEARKIDLKQIKYTVVVANKLSFDQWAEIAIERYVYNTLDRFINNEMYKMYMENSKYLDIKVTLITEVNEWKMEQE